MKIELKVESQKLKDNALVVFDNKPKFDSFHF